MSARHIAVLLLAHLLQMLVVAVSSWVASLLLTSRYQNLLAEVVYPVLLVLKAVTSLPGFRHKGLALKVSRMQKLRCRVLQSLLWAAQ